MIVIDKIWVRALYVLFILGWTIGDIQYNVNDDFKYAISIVSIILGLFVILYNYILSDKKKKIETFAIKRVIFVIIVFIIVSCLYMVKNGFHFVGMRYIMLIVFPVIQVFTIINVDDSENKDFYFDLILIGQIIVFFMHFRESFNMEQIMSISFEESYSPFESVAADYFCLLCYYYFINNKIIRCIISAIFCYLSFKRFHILFLVIMFLFGWLLKKIKINNFIIIITEIFFICSPIILSLITSETFVSWFDATFSISFQQFTMGRFGQITQLAKLDIPIYGLGSIDYYLKSNHYYIITIHCDMLRFYWETNAIGLISFVMMYFGLVRKNTYNYLLLVFLFIIMLISTCIQMYLTWFMAFLIIEQNLYQENNRLEENNTISKGAAYE